MLCTGGTFLYLVATVVRSVLYFVPSETFMLDYNSMGLGCFRKYFFHNGVADGGNRSVASAALPDDEYLIFVSLCLIQIQYRPFKVSMQGPLTMNTLQKLYR